MSIGIRSSPRMRVNAIILLKMKWDKINYFAVVSSLYYQILNHLEPSEKEFLQQSIFLSHSTNTKEKLMDKLSNDENANNTSNNAETVNEGEMGVAKGWVK